MPTILLVDHRHAARPETLSISTPVEVTRQVVADAIATGVQYIWMHRGAEDKQDSQSASEAGINIIDDGSCTGFYSLASNVRQHHGRSGFIEVAYCKLVWIMASSKS